VKPSHTACVTVVQQQRAEYISTGGLSSCRSLFQKRAVLDPLLCTGGNTAFTEPAHHTGEDTVKHDRQFHIITQSLVKVMLQRFFGRFYL